MAQYFMTVGPADYIRTCNYSAIQTYGGRKKADGRLGILFGVFYVRVSLLDEYALMCNFCNSAHFDNLHHFVDFW
jgi:hypothetical protein